MINTTRAIIIALAFVPWLAVAQPELEGLKRAAEAGDAAGQFELAVMYATGQGVEQNSDEALRLFRLAAEQGLADAQFEAALWTRDPVESATWYQRAAEQGHQWAQLNLSDLYDSGIGVPQNFGIRAQWLRRSAQQGNPLAQQRLGSAYWSGRGVEKNLILAYVWLSVSAAQDIGTARGQRDRVASELTSEQIAQAQEISTRCLESNYATCEVSSDFQQ